MHTSELIDHSRKSQVCIYCRW